MVKNIEMFTGAQTQASRRCNSTRGVLFQQEPYWKRVPTTTGADRERTSGFGVEQ